MTNSNNPVEPVTLDSYEQKLAELEQAMTELKRVMAANPEAIVQLMSERDVLRQSLLTQVYPPPRRVTPEDKRPTGVYDTEGKSMFVHTIGGYEYSFDISYILPNLRCWFIEVVSAQMNDIHIRAVIETETNVFDKIRCVFGG
jgi:hypothetical protein